VASILSGTINFTASSSQSVYGWWLENSGGDLLMCARFAGAPLTIDTGSDVDVIIRFRLRQMTA
jgi:hypothetical protein